MRSAVVVCCVLGAAGAVTATSAAAASSAPSFAGTCDFGGVETTFTPPLSGRAVPLSLDMLGQGVCTGQLDGTPITKKLTTLEAHVEGRASCLVTEGYMTGDATIRSGSTAIPLKMRFRLDGVFFIRVDFTGGTGTASGTGQPLGTLSIEPKRLLAYDVGCFPATVCDAVTLDCRTQDRAAIVFGLDTHGTTLTPAGQAPVASAPPRPRRTPQLTTLMSLPAAQRCGRDPRLRVSVARSWRSRVRSVRVIARGRSVTAPGRRSITLRGPRARSLLVRFEVRLRDGRVRTGTRRFRACR